MSKSKYNVQTPDELVEKFGADTLRCYEMFLGPLEQAKPWDTKGINGVHNFLRKFWRLFHDATNNFVVSDGEADKASLKTLHKTIKIQDDLERYSFNTAVSNFMIATNELTEQKCNNREVLSQLLILLSPYAPHITEELWALLGNEKSITQTVSLILIQRIWWKPSLPIQYPLMGKCGLPCLYQQTWTKKPWKKRSLKMNKR